MPDPESATDLPKSRFHPDPLRSGSVVPSGTTCRCCTRARGFIYEGPVYTEHDALDDALCPWCIADGSAHEMFDATFVDSEAFLGDVPEETAREVTLRTVGYNAWQTEQWPVCCDDATAYLTPLGIAELRSEHRELEGAALNHIIYALGISGGAASRLLGALRRDQSPTAFLFQCLSCQRYHFHIDQT